MKNSTQVILIAFSVTAVLVLSFLLVRNDTHPITANPVSYPGLKSLVIGLALLTTALVLRKSPKKRKVCSSSEILSSEAKFSIRNLTFMFTDLKESTKIYDTLGDAKAFSMVFDHLELIREIIRNNEGTIVKTMGDAVMGVFSSSKGALRAAFEIQKTFLNKDNKNLIVKVGLHRGPCIAITLNDRLDYFGSTVNIAARVQKLSEGGDFIITKDVIEGPEVLEWKTSRIERFNASLKGLREDYNLYRVCLL